MLAGDQLHWQHARPLLLVAICGVLGACFMAVGLPIWSRSGDSRTYALGQARVAQSRFPVRIEPRSDLPGFLDSSKVVKILGRLRPDRPGSVGEIVHDLRLFGPTETIHWGDQDHVATLIDALLDESISTSLVGSPPLFVTRTGVRCRVTDRDDSRKQKDRQAHEDQLLSALAEAGVPLSRPLHLVSSERTVQGILDDAVAKFDLAQDEIEWSALAFALYLPPMTRWTDKFGRVCTFDRLVEDMMGRKLEGRSCLGCHILYSLSVILRVDEQVPIMSSPVADRLKVYLGDMASLAIRHQNADGGWDTKWQRAPGAYAEDQGLLSSRVLATSHLAEWLMILPVELGPPPDRLLGAASWLERRLEAATAQEIAESHCPYTHAGRVISWASRREADSGRPRQAHGISADLGILTVRTPVRASFQGGSLGRVSR